MFVDDNQYEDDDDDGEDEERDNVGYLVNPFDCSDHPVSFLLVENRGSLKMVANQPLATSNADTSFSHHQQGRIACQSFPVHREGFADTLPAER